MNRKYYSNMLGFFRGPFFFPLSPGWRGWGEGLLSPLERGGRTPKADGRGVFFTPAHSAKKTFFCKGPISEPPFSLRSRLKSSGLVSDKVFHNQYRIHSPGRPGPERWPENA